MRVHLLAAVAFVALCAPATAEDAKITAERELEDRGIELTIATPAFTAPTKVEVFLPAGYDDDPKRRWPVLYYLHGAQGDQARFHAWYIKQIADFPGIVVAPNGGQLGFYSDWYNAGAGGPPMFETFHIRQLVPLIDQRFRTTGRRAGRAVIGESMGGYGVSSYAARHPDVFAAAATLSGLNDNAYPAATALISAGPPSEGGLPNAIYGDRATDEIRWRGHNPVDLADNLRDVDLQVRTFEGIPNPVFQGGPDSAVACTTERGVYQSTITFQTKLVALQIPHIFKNYGAGCHGLNEFQREFSDSLPRILRVFARPTGAPRTFRYRTIEPRFRIWRWRVRTDPARAVEFLHLRRAGRGGITLIGSGTTRVTTPPYFRGRNAVEVITPEGSSVLRPDARGRLHLTVKLGPPHPNQQDTQAAADAGEGRPGYAATQTLRFKPR